MESPAVLSELLSCRAPSDVLRRVLLCIGCEAWHQKKELP